jgi:hypothetical protein
MACCEANVVAAAAGGAGEPAFKCQAGKHLIDLGLTLLLLPPLLLPMLLPLLLLLALLLLPLLLLFLLQLNTITVIPQAPRSVSIRCRDTRRLCKLLLVLPLLVLLPPAPHFASRFACTPVDTCAPVRVFATRRSRGIGGRCTGCMLFQSAAVGATLLLLLLCQCLQVALGMGVAQD